MPRFFVTEEDISDGVAAIRGEDAYHIARSLRMAVGESVTVCDGTGREYPAVLTDIHDALCHAACAEGRLGEGEPPMPITLYMGMPKGDKFELVIQKAVELGACRIVPFISERCIMRPKEDKSKERNARYCRIAMEAAKQCGRARVPTVGLPLTFAQMLAEAAGAALPLFCYEAEGTEPLTALAKGRPVPGSVAVVVGSEGGFSPAEAEAARAAGLCLTGLGKRILRCETAPLYALAALSVLYEL